MNRPAIIARIHAALDGSRRCHEHDRPIPRGQGFNCDHCMLEQKTGRKIPTFAQIMAGKER